MFDESPFTGICTNATFEVLFMLISTLLLGLILGWLIWGRLKKRLRMLEQKIKELEHIIEIKDGQIADLNDRIRSLRDNARLLESQRDNSMAQSASSAVFITALKEQRLDVHPDNREIFEASKSEAADEASALFSAPTPEAKTSPSTELAPADPAVIQERRSKNPLDKGATRKSLEKAASVFGRVIEANDLKIIEGIGPKIEEVLKERGILTWRKLGETKAPLLKAILSDAGSQFKTRDPKFWSKQAKMAAKGEWKKLLAYQKHLK